MEQFSEQRRSFEERLTQIQDKEFTDYEKFLEKLVSNNIITKLKAPLLALELFRFLSIKEIDMNVSPGSIVNEAWRLMRLDEDLDDFYAAVIILLRSGSQSGIVKSENQHERYENCLLRYKEVFGYPILPSLWPPTTNSEECDKPIQTLAAATTASGASPIVSTGSLNVVSQTQEPLPTIGAKRRNPYDGHDAQFSTKANSDHTSNYENDCFDDDDFASPAAEADTSFESTTPTPPVELKAGDAHQQYQQYQQHQQQSSSSFNTTTCSTVTTAAVALVPAAETTTSTPCCPVTSTSSISSRKPSSKTKVPLNDTPDSTSTSASSPFSSSSSPSSSLQQWPFALGWFVILPDQAALEAAYELQWEDLVEEYGFAEWEVVGSYTMYIRPCDGQYSRFQSLLNRKFTNTESSKLFPIRRILTVYNKC